MWLRHVRAHTKVKGNEVADGLAKKAAADAGFSGSGRDVLKMALEFFLSFLSCYANRAYYCPRFALCRAPRRSRAASCATARLAAPAWPPCARCPTWTRP